MRTVWRRALPRCVRGTLQRARSDLAIWPALPRPTEYPLEHQVRHEWRGYDRVIDRLVAPFSGIVEVTFEERTPLVDDELHTIRRALFCQSAAARHERAARVLIDDGDTLP